ncbi:DUF2064 domain-containing protein [Arthrobacter sp. AL08]|uniref:TIGR04282 family arsenosugar biosynthesis glycosyltransferase n=1 Tax=Micrococcaceae TaxID=1268 RepID=UPI00249BD642|nr:MULTISPECIES: DUF2064 domain-containing protein [Micrococcaceae]MDI3243404.1 DUF2064 domain-containing protein [Arthrobacter sp. AL05]MDI3279413.1 DUF2064 domain-containing protein [Arthrobacter sp. AL08]MDJ0354336.1 DUF2064 domain-containing protein [Pseudarthrobacter sp. PH31-O2]
MRPTLQLRVAVFAKECRPGRVKTRLSPPLTPDQAADLAQRSLSRTLDTIRVLPVSERLLVMDGTPSARDAAGFAVMAQTGGPLDERLAAICDETTGPLLIVGMDTPQISAAHLAPLLMDWSAATPQHDAWLGPAEDGGFWALALRRPEGALVRGVPMSTDKTGSEQLSRLAAGGLSVGLLAVLRDMDRINDAREIAAEIPGTEFAAAVAAAIEKILVMGRRDKPADRVTFPGPAQVQHRTPAPGSGSRTL